MALGATITCGDCGKSEFFAGDLLTSIDASKDSGHWFTNKRGFLVCGCMIGLSVPATQKKREQLSFDL